MRAVLDTNTVVSGFLWEGAASGLLTAARERRIDLYTSADLLAELIDVLPRKKFARKLQAAGLSVAQLTQLHTGCDPQTGRPLATPIGLL